MNDNLNTLISVDAVNKRYREIRFTNNIVLQEIQLTIKAVEYEEAILIEEFRDKFYSTVIDSIMTIQKKILQYKVDIETNISIFETALELQEDINMANMDTLSVVLQTTLDEAKITVNEIDTLIEYLQNKSK